MTLCSIPANEAWACGSFLLEMKPHVELASLFVNCPDMKLPDTDGQESIGLLRVEDQSLELTFDTGKEMKQKLSANLVDILLDPATLCSMSWADTRQQLMMCKVKAEVDCVSFAPKTIKKLEEELAQICHLREYVEQIERNRRFHVNCRQCGYQIHSHCKGEFEFGVLPSDDWLDTSAQMDYFCGLSGFECCGAHLDSLTSHHNEGILGFSTKLSADSTRQWLPGERKIVFSNSFALFRKNERLISVLREKEGENVPVRIVTCSACDANLGTTLKNHSDIFKLHWSVLHVYGDNPQRTAYISSRFRSMESYLAWLLLNKCELHSSVKLIVRSLDRTPHLLIWLLEPYVLLTRGLLKEIGEVPNASTKSSSKALDDNQCISFPALKILYKCFDSDASKQDPRANGGDSSVAILEVPLGCCLQLTELLLSSSLALPPPLRALGQFYVGFIRLKDRLD